MLKKDQERDKLTKTNDQTTSGRVKQICQNFLVHSDSGLAHRLQEEEFAAHFDRNRTHRHESRLGVKAARDVEEEERQAFVAKKMDFYQEKQKLEESDIALAQQLQDQINIKSNSIDRTKYSNHYQSFDDQDHYEEVEQPSTCVDTSSDEQLARILQEEEEEELSSDAIYHSHFNSTTV